MHPSLQQFPKTLYEPRNILNSSTSKKLFISWNTEYKQVTFLTNNTSIVAPHCKPFKTYSIYDEKLTQYCDNTSAYLIPWQFEDYKEQFTSKAIKIQEGDSSTCLNSSTIYTLKNEETETTLHYISNDNKEITQLNLNEDYTDDNCRYFFTENYLFVAYTCKDYLITNTLDVGAFELHETVLTNMKNYFTKEKKEEEKNIDYQVFVYEWDPEKIFEFKVDNEEFTITYNDDNSITINATNSKKNIQSISQKEKKDSDNNKKQTEEITKKNNQSNGNSHFNQSLLNWVKQNEENSRDNKKPKASIWGLKGVFYSLLGLSLIILIVKKGYAFFNFK